MPGDPAILEGVPATLSTADLLNNVTVKLPLFWPENIEKWFVQAESQFCLRAVTISQTKFDYCIQAMPQKVTVKVLDLIRNPPTENPYQHLKDRLLWMYALNDNALVKAFANLPLSVDMQLPPSCLGCSVSYLLVTSLALSYELPF